MSIRKACLTLAALAVAAVAPIAAMASPNLVADPGFELNDGSWTLSGFGTASGPAYSNTGNNSAGTGCVGNGCVSTLGLGAFIQQTLATTAGQAYTLTFFVGEDDGPTSEMSVFWDGALIADVVNPANNSAGTPPQGSFVQFTYTGLAATSGATLLEVHGRQDPAGLYLDDFSVTLADAAAVPEPASVVLLGMGLAGLRLAGRRKAG